ncbi:MAG: hypothetical protein PVF34_12880, partial [Gammaproteobacteria bacterium]
MALAQYKTSPTSKLHVNPSTVTQLPLKDSVDHQLAGKSQGIICDNATLVEQAQRDHPIVITTLGHFNIFK